MGINGKGSLSDWFRKKEIFQLFYLGHGLCFGFSAANRFHRKKSLFVLTKKRVSPRDCGYVITNSIFDDDVFIFGEVYHVV